MFDEDLGYDPISDLQNCLNELREKSPELNLEETKDLLNRVRTSARKAVNCAKVGMYYRYWYGLLSSLNSTYEAINEMSNQSDEITKIKVEEVLNLCFSGVSGFALFVKKHFREFKDVLDITGPVFTNTMHVLILFGKFVKESFKLMIQNVIDKIKELWEKTIKFLKENTSDILVYTISGAGLAAITRTLCLNSAKSFVFGTGLGMVEHCLIGGGFGFGVGFVVGLTKEGFQYLSERKKNEKIKNLLHRPEVSAQEAEKRGLVEINCKIDMLINLLSKIDKEAENRNDYSYAYQYSRLVANLLEMQKEIPKVANTCLELENQQSQ